MSRVVVFDRFGGPEVLHLLDERPADPAPGEVLVRVQAAAVNPIDAMVRSGASPAPVPLPHARLGIEATGVVETVGARVAGLRPGDPVIVTAIPDAAANGSYADHIVVPAADLIPRPPQLSIPEAAAAWVAFSTAYGALVDVAGMRPADRVLITGATGGVGRAAIEVANQLGAVPIASTRRASRAAELMDAGAAAVVAADRDDLVTAGAASQPDVARTSCSTCCEVPDRRTSSGRPGSAERSWPPDSSTRAPRRHRPTRT
jgi:NADPH:quinone reductase-like Zn-dependent oxidoreductase